MATFLTVAELADRLGVSASTIRNWRRAYGDLIPSTVGRDGLHRYSRAAYETVAVLRRRNLPLSAIRSSLREQDAAPEEEPRPSYEERQVAALERIAAAAERIASRLEREGG